MRILVASKNPVKIDGVRQAFSNYFDDFEILNFSVDSEVPGQPFNEQMIQGTDNRIKNLMKINTEQNLNADFFVALESGIEKRGDRWFNMNSACVTDKNGKKGYGCSSFFELPNHFIEKMQNEKVELCHVAETVSGCKDIRSKHGISGFFTKKVITRTKLSVDAVVSALVPFINKEIFEKK